MKDDMMHFNYCNNDLSEGYDSSSIEEPSHKGKGRYHQDKYQKN